MTELVVSPEIRALLAARDVRRRLSDLLTSVSQPEPAAITREIARIDDNLNVRSSALRQNLRFGTVPFPHINSIGPFPMYPRSFIYDEPSRMIGLNGTVGRAQFDPDRAESLGSRIRNLTGGTHAPGRIPYRPMALHRRTDYSARSVITSIYSDDSANFFATSLIEIRASLTRMQQRQLSQYGGGWRPRRFLHATAQPTLITLQLFDDLPEPPKHCENVVEYIHTYVQNTADLHCSVCLENIADEVAAISCGHKYHRECITGWLAVNLNCPECRCVCMKPRVRSNYELELD